jgi:hypothetical protein
MDQPSWTPPPVPPPAPPRKKSGLAVVLTFQNLTLAETRREFQRLAADPAARNLP